MELSVAMKIKEDVKLHQYLITHSYWYRLLNRDSRELDNLIKEFKTFKRDTNFNKVNEVVDNIELFSNVMKFM